MELQTASPLGGPRRRRDGGRLAGLGPGAGPACDGLFANLDPETIVVAEEMPSSRQQGSLLRTQGWGLVPGRGFPVTINSCVLRVTPFHRPLLHRWQELLADSRYQEAQRKPILRRPPWFQSDQDVLNACSAHKSSPVCRFVS